MDLAYWKRQDVEKPHEPRWNKFLDWDCHYEAESQTVTERRMACNAFHLR